MNILTGKELEETIKNRKIAREMAQEQAMRGDAICGGLFVLEAIAYDAGLDFVATTMQDYDDEDDEARPY